MAEAGEVVPLRRLQRSWCTDRVRSETSAPGQRILRGHGRVQKGRGWPCGGAHNRSHDCPSPPFPRPSRKLLSPPAPAARRTGGKERRPWAVLEAAAPPPHRRLFTPLRPVTFSQDFVREAASRPGVGGSERAYFLHLEFVNSCAHYCSAEHVLMLG